MELPTRIAAAGATGHIGTLVSSILERRGVDVVPISRSHGLDLITLPTNDMRIRDANQIGGRRTKQSASPS